MVDGLKGVVNIGVLLTLPSGKRPFRRKEETQTKRGYSRAYERDKITKISSCIRILLDIGKMWGLSRSKGGNAGVGDGHGVSTSDGDRSNR